MKSCPVFCRWFFAFFPALILLAPGIAFSAVLTVGADQPYATIAGALDAVQGDSDVIRIMDPVHTESSIKIRKNVTIEGLGAYDTIVQAHAQPGMASDRVFTVDINTTVTLRDMTIRHGRVVGVSPEGGGILNMGALALYGCHIIDNRVEADTECFAVGGGIHNHFNAKSLWLEECRISGNVCAAQPGVSANCYGGGIYSMAPLTLVNCLLEGNQARDSGTLTSVGGGLATQNFPVFLSGCSFLSNFSRDIAGGISILGQDLTLENCTLSGNVAALEYGGGVCLSGVKNCQIINSTIVENQASADKGGGLAVLDTAAVFIQNSILCHNGGEDYLLRYGGTLVSGGYNLAGTDPLSLFTASGDIVGSDPLLGPPALNGGLIPTRALLPGSPCMDVIPSDYLPTDQRGVSRPQGRLGDMGAFEVLEGPDLGFLSGILDLGSWPVNRGESAPVSFPVINIGKLTLPAIALSLDSGKEFKISGEQVREINLAPGETGQIALIFDPADTGLRADTLSIDNPPSHTLSLSIPVMGTGYNTRPVAGKYEPDQVLQFRETMQQHVQIPDAPAFNLTFKFTLEAWVRPSFKGWETILSRGDGNQNEKTSYIFSIEEGTRRLALMAAGAWHYSTKSVPMGKWTHVAVSYDGQDKRFFINGEPDSTVSCPGSIYGSVDSIYIGRQGTECNCNFFDGFMDEVRIWHRALDAQEIKSRMNVSFSGPETGLIGCWNFNWIQGQETPDSSGFNHNGTLVNAPLPQSLPDSPMTRIIGAYDLFTDEDTDLEVPLFASDADSDEPLDVMITCLPEPRHGRLFQFTGNWPVRGERITQPGTRITDPEKRLVFAPANRREGYDVILRWKAHDGWEESDNPTTITINVAADNDPPVAGIPLPGCGVIFNKGARQYVSVKAAPSLETPFAFTVEAWVKSSLHEWNTIISRGNGNDNLLTSYIFSLEGETGRLGLSAGGEWHYSESSIPPGVWQHVAVSYDGFEKKFYINGVLDAVHRHKAAIRSTPDDDIFIGRQGTDCNCNFFDGAIAEVRLWNRVRSEFNIRRDMMNLSPSDDSGLAGWWRFLEGEGGAARDSGPHGNNGILVNGADWIMPSLTSVLIHSNVSMEAFEDEDTTITLGAFDPDGDEPLTAAIVELPEPSVGEIYQFAGPGPLRGERINAYGFQITDPLMRLVFVPAPGRAGGTHYLRWSVSDGSLSSNNVTQCAINVIPRNQPPEFNLLTPPPRGALTEDLYTVRWFMEDDGDTTLTLYWLCPVNKGEALPIEDNIAAVNGEGAVRLSFLLFYLSRGPLLATAYDGFNDPVLSFSPGPLVFTFIDGNSLRSYIAGREICPGELLYYADWNRDGRLDVADLVQFLLPR